MKNVQKELTAYLEDSYFRATPVIKAHGLDVSHREVLEEDLRNFLDTIPSYIEVEDYQYTAIVRWIDTEIGHVNSQLTLSKPTEISILTYINTCYKGKTEMSDTEREAYNTAYVIAANAVRLAIPAEQNAGDELTPLVCDVLRKISFDLETTRY